MIRFSASPAIPEPRFFSEGARAQASSWVARLNKSQIFLLLMFTPLLSACSKVFYQPDQLYHFPPAQIDLEPREVRFISRDGTELYGWFFAADAEGPGPKTAPKGTIVQFHGNAQNMSSHYLSLVWLTHRGYNLFTFDYRGYGKSKGDPDQKGVYEDALAALDQAWQLHQSMGAFVVDGQSLGGAVAMRALKDWKKRDHVDLLVMDSTFLSYREVAQRFLARHWFTWILSPLPYILVSDEYSAASSLESWRGRLLVLHDRQDPVVPFELGKKTYDLAKCPKDFWEFDQGRHVGSFDVLEASDPAQTARDRLSKYLDGLGKRNH